MQKPFDAMTSADRRVFVKWRRGVCLFYASSALLVVVVISASHWLTVRTQTAEAVVATPISPR
jgi:hypothetical protein